VRWLIPDRRRKRSRADLVQIEHAADVVGSLAGKASTERERLAYQDCGVYCIPPVLTHVAGRYRTFMAEVGRLRRPVEADSRAAGVVVEPDALAEQGCVPRADLNLEPSE
jgi:hypothetical protein